jgi:hypothetical protein
LDRAGSGILRDKDQDFGNLLKEAQKKEEKKTPC